VCGIFQQPVRAEGLALAACAAAGAVTVVMIAMIATVATMPTAARAQLAESRTDATGISIPYPFVHLVHADDTGRGGGTAQLRGYDPFLFYQLGRDLLRRQFTLPQGLYGRSGELSVPLYLGPAAAAGATPVHGVPARFARDDASSCIFCHSSPYHEPGSGQVIASTGGMGRRSTHLYGAGLIEMLGEQVRALILEQYDTNRNGRIDRAEVRGPCPVLIRPTPGAAPIDFGDLSPDASGVPRLNPVFRIWYLDGDGRLLPDALGLDDPRVASFDFAMAPFGWGRGYRTAGSHRVAQGGEAVTLREFYTVAADVHMGMQAFDPTQQGHDGVHGAGGLAAVSLNGAQQFDFGGSVDLGIRRTPAGISLDDPDHDGVVNELSEGDVDAVEFYMLHAPAPAVRATAASEAGREVLTTAGCTRCHVENWQIEARDDRRGLRGDRRLFRLATRSRLDASGVPQIEGSLVPLDQRLATGEVVPKGDAFVVERIYTDFKHWDLGPAFDERRFDGTLQREHRTAPLWGVGASESFGHAGNFLTLDSVIRAHAGAAAAESAAYAALAPARREQLLAYLESLVLYNTDEIPADIDGDGVIASRFLVAGQDVGYERFDARFLVRHLPRYRKVREVVNEQGMRVVQNLIVNVNEVFGLDLPWRRDANGDGFPDVLGPVPHRSGRGQEEQRNGEKNRGP
jgi:hypothetical protein